MTIEIIVLAMASTIRPTSLAAIYALLAHRSPRALMLAYVIHRLRTVEDLGEAPQFEFHALRVARNRRVVGTSHFIPWTSPASVDTGLLGGLGR